MAQFQRKLPDRNATGSTEVNVILVLNKPATAANLASISMRASCSGVGMVDLIVEIHGLTRISRGIPAAA
ncbi:MAG: hypothetical protein ACO3JG_01700 [Luteolibacter sp.]